MASVASGTASRRLASLASQVEKYLRHTSKPKPIELVYSTSPAWPFSPSATAKQIDIGVLDSSFNPPQRAHYALASLYKPQLRDGAVTEERKRFDAVLLLFSVRNADKGTGTSKDASPAQRLYMMELLAHDLSNEHGTAVAVGMVEEPLMISKSTLIHEYIQNTVESNTTAGIPRPPVRLHWLVGFDTLERFFQVKYYPSPDFFREACRKFFAEERTTFICARRGIESLPNAQQARQPSSSDEAEHERKLLEDEYVKPWVERNSIVMIDLDASVRNVSSTAVRKLLVSDTSSSDTEQQVRTMTSPSVASFLLLEKVYEKNE